jgi:hypothetical protein
MRTAGKITPMAVAVVLVNLVLSGASLVLAGPEPNLSKGGTVYVPAYSHVYHGDKEHPFYVAAALSIRNTDPEHSITIVEMNYHDAKGQLLKKWLEKPVQIGPQASEEVIVKESDKSGGFGAHFIVKWKAGHEVNAPIMESVMIGSSGQQGISFTSRGQTLREN